MGAQSHIDSLDGVRALAIGLVIIFHLGIAQFGWIGVQIFFVLSGYLITSILAQERSAPFAQYLKRFYWRRSLRIFPLYFVFLLCAAGFYVATGQPASFATDWPWLVTYSANFARLRETDLGSNFVHLWSLAVEEQFYLVWPILVYFLPLPSFRAVVVALLLLSPISRTAFWLVFQSSDAEWLGRSLYGLPTSQFDAFAAGAAISLWPIRKAARYFCLALLLTGVSGTAVLIHQHLAHEAAMKWSFGYAMFLMQDGEFVWGYSFLNVTSAFGIAAAIQIRPRFLELAPITRIGIISYGLYVWHLPLFLLLERMSLPKSLFVPACLCAAYAIAEISYRYLETPFLKLKDHMPTERPARSGLPAGSSVD
jgi:peptidoglycan/LPS O-acetylase OafA/YrhL